jgi:hypothetical protein
MPETVPERLYRPDVSITAWRRLCEQARGLVPVADPNHNAAPSGDDQLATADALPSGEVAGGQPVGGGTR